MSRFASVVRWFDSWAGDDEPLEPARAREIDWLRVAPFVLLHAGVLLVFVVGWSPVALWVALAAYAVRMFAITAFYHRYCSHRAFCTSRALQLALALLGASAVQRGPLWWAAHHRRHHRHSDGEHDAHSPARDGFWWSHVGWLLARENFRTRREEVRDLARYPELCFLDRFDALVPLACLVLSYALGAVLARVAPELGTSGPQMLVWGFVVSTVALYHGTFAINSFAHRFGSRRFATQDASRNNALLALLTLGEGWHNNHHQFPGAARQGLRWWELDATYYVLRLLAALGLVWDLRAVPASVRARRGRR
jgi:stearoyl-CoA desaturase (delta-9 desaturase)